MKQKTKQCWFVVSCSLRNTLQCDLNHITTISSNQSTTFENICEVSSILLLVQYVLAHCIPFYNEAIRVILEIFVTMQTMPIDVEYQRRQVN